MSGHLNLAARYSDRLVVMCEGAIVVSDAPREVLTEELLADTFGHTAWVVENRTHDGRSSCRWARGTPRGRLRPPVGPAGG